jgi:hypothetical protein
MPQPQDIFRDNSPPSDFSLRLALEEIYDTYGCIAEYKGQRFTRAGKFDALGTSYVTVQEQGGIETLLTSNLINTVVSTSAGDTTSVVIEGFTIDTAGNLTFVTQTVTLNGLTNVTLPTPLARAGRLYNNGTVDFVGVVKVFVSGTPGTVYLQASGISNASAKCAGSVASTDFWVITEIFGVILLKTSASVDYSLQVRPKGSVFREIYAWAGNSPQTPNPHTLSVPLIIPPNSDVRLQAKAGVINTEVVTRISGHLARITDPWNYIGWVG